MGKEEPRRTRTVKFSEMTLLDPADPKVCRQCATEHDPAMPHNQQSLQYQYWFRGAEARAGRKERWPTWSDAMAHCTPEVREQWTTALRQHGVQVG